MKKKSALVFMSCILALLSVGCDKKNDSTVDTGSKVSDTAAVIEQEGMQVAETEDTQSLNEPANTDISPDRLVTDDTEIIKIVDSCFEKYFNGIKNESHDECFSSFPDFYKKAVEEENKTYNQQNDEYIKEINSDLKASYGDDYYAYASVSAVLQIVDSSLEEMESTINKSFDISIKLEDAFSVYVQQVIRGSLDSRSDELEYMLLKIDGEYYLYDQYYEVQ